MLLCESKSGTNSIVRKPAYLEVSLTGLEEEGRSRVDDETMDFPCAGSTFNGQIGILARVICSSCREHRTDDEFSEDSPRKAPIKNI